MSPKKSEGEMSVFSQHHSLFNVAIIPQRNDIRRFEGGNAISIHIAEWTRNWALVSCVVHVKCLLQCHLHSFPFPPTAAEHAIGTGLSQSNLSGSISGMVLNREYGPGDRETANFVQFQRVIFIFDSISESTNRHLDNP